MRYSRFAVVLMVAGYAGISWATTPASQPARPPASQPAGKVELGLAAKFPGDVGLAKDPAVLFAEDFEADSVAAVAKRWNEMSNKNGKPLAISDEHPAGSSGKHSLQVTATLGQDTGGHLYKVLRPGADRLFARFYLKFADDAPYVHHFVTMGALRDAPNWPSGEAGLRPDGARRFTSGLEPWGDWGRFATPPGAWNFYSYWHEMKKSPDGMFWGNSFRPERPALADRGRWMCMEMMIQTNSAPDKADGAQAFWIDGRLAGRFESIRWRTAADLKINFFWLMLYVTDNAGRQNHVAKPNPICRVWFDDLVLATEYVGPIRPVKTTAKP